MALSTRPSTLCRLISSDVLWGIVIRPMHLSRGRVQHTVAKKKPDQDIAILNAETIFFMFTGNHIFGLSKFTQSVDGSTY